ncbi:hypothetical protein E5676_scaffold604G00190 [Cucumis melo var. makuwa]|uniref:Uncharacterized protein n=1 Tax=Cucumis melo var. makuwa TaxID=1194695 RepID=A0A5D3DA30_CUCMM|nr:hypothetical protein E5676_scaffold604G00190 [Cucumis melo var. makuwa]
MGYLTRLLKALFLIVGLPLHPFRLLLPRAAAAISSAFSLSVLHPTTAAGRLCLFSSVASPSPSSRLSASTFHPSRPPTISDLLSVSRTRTPPCVFRPTVSADNQSPSAALKQSRSSDSTKPRRVFVVEPPKIVVRGCPGGSVERGLDRGHNQVSGKGFPTTAPRIEAGNVVIHRGLHVTRPLVVACVPSGVRSCLRIDTDVGCSVYCSYVNGLRCGLKLSTRLICASFGSTRLICASFGSTRLICASLGITRLVGVSFKITRLIRASFRITRLICAFYGSTRLLCRVRVQRGADRREAGRMREGHMDASGFLYASADIFCSDI